MKPNRFEFTSSDVGFAVSGGSQSEIEQARKQALAMFGTVMMPAVVYKGRTFERRVLA